MADNGQLRVAVIGAGPGGYPAAFLAADHGLDVTLIDRNTNPGGVCLYIGCIPSKALLHVAKILNESREAEAFGVHFEEPKLDLDGLRGWKQSVVGKLTGGLGTLAKQRKVRYVQGEARFEDAQTLTVTKEDGTSEPVPFDHAIIATGSDPIELPFLPYSSPRIMDSTQALELEEVPETLMVVGGGYIGLELGTVYASLGSKVTVVEALGELIPGTDRDLAEQLTNRLDRLFHEVLINTKVTEAEDTGDGVRVKLVGMDLEQPERTFDKVLVAVGRRPRSKGFGLEHTNVELDRQGFIVVDEQRRTAEPNLWAIGDVAGQPMLAHKATYEAKVAVEAIRGEPAIYDPHAIPAVVFTDPELAWCGMTERGAREQGLEVKITRFPWAASGRATTLGRTDGLTKLITDPITDRVLGMGIVGVGAGEMIAEAVLAVEMGARADDLKMTMHAHPTLSETVMESAELIFGTAPHYKGRS